MSRFDPVRTIEVSGRHNVEFVVMYDAPVPAPRTWRHVPSGYPVGDWNADETVTPSRYRQNAPQ